MSCPAAQLMTTHAAPNLSLGPAHDSPSFSPAAIPTPSPLPGPLVSFAFPQLGVSISGPQPMLMPFYLYCMPHQLLCNPHFPKLSLPQPIQWKLARIQAILSPNNSPTVLFAILFHMFSLPLFWTLLSPRTLLKHLVSRNVFRYDKGI